MKEVVGLTADFGEARRRLVVAAHAWCRAVGTFGEPISTSLILAEDAVLERWNAGGLKVAQRIAGRPAIRMWLASAMPAARFDLVEGSLWVRRADPCEADVRYRVRVEDFTNWGTWWLRLGPTSLLTFVRHVPDSLP